VWETFSTERIDEDVVLVEDVRKVPFFSHPHKIIDAVVVICLKGYAEGSVDLKPCRYAANDFFIVLPGQTVQYAHRSANFSALITFLSRRFIENLELNMKDVIPVFLYLRENQVVHLNNEELALLTSYYYTIKRAVQQVHNPHRLEMVRLLAQAFFYGLNAFEQLQPENAVPKNKKDELFSSFYRLVLQHYRASRELNFYADKLCMTPNYLSAVIKETTGKSAFEWINDYVILEAKSLLKSTNMTVQQISDELNFANQSFFGKYFKRLVGVSPKGYRGEE
jgi:AraC-like DNA-binding protein